MKVIYPVIFTKIDDGYLIEVKDLDILTEGNSYLDATRMAKDVIQLQIKCLRDDNLEIPLPSPIDEINIENGTFQKYGNSSVELVETTII